MSQPPFDPSGARRAAGWGDHPGPVGYATSTWRSPWTPPRRTNTIAVLAIVFAFFVPVLGIILGAVARRQIARTGEEGRSLATLGLVLGIVFTALTVVLVVAGGIALAVFGTGVGHAVTHLSPFPSPTGTAQGV